jgi:hypothetical protein
MRLRASRTATDSRARSGGPAERRSATTCRHRSTAASLCESQPEGCQNSVLVLNPRFDTLHGLERAIKAEDAPLGEYFRLDVVESLSDEAVPLPRNLLDADEDRRWVFNTATQAYELLG